MRRPATGEARAVWNEPARIVPASPRAPRRAPGRTSRRKIVRGSRRALRRAPRRVPRRQWLNSLSTELGAAHSEVPIADCRRSGEVAFSTSSACKWQLGLFYNLNERRCAAALLIDAVAGELPCSARAGPRGTLPRERRNERVYAASVRSLTRAIRV